MDIASLGYEVDTKELKDAERHLGKLAKQTDKADKETRQFNKSSDKMTKGLRGMLGPLKALGPLLAGLGVGLLGKSFTEAAKTTENYRVRLQALLKDQQKTNQVFADMAKFAGSVPFEFEKIMGAATNLTAVMQGNTDAVKRMMGPVADIAAATGLTIEQVGEQFGRIQSAGIASADLFKERGVSAALAIP
jgi:phage tail tape-measure protein